MNFSITSPDQILKIDVVYEGCDMIDKAMSKFIEVGATTVNASSYLGAGSLQFGEAGASNSTFTDTLETIIDNIEKFEAISDGETARIRAQAQAQYEAECEEYNRYLRWVEEQNKENDGNDY